MATLRYNSMQAVSGQLSKAAQARVNAFPRKLRPIVRSVELAEVTLSMFVAEIVRYVGDPARDDYRDVQCANWLLAYLRCLPTGQVDIEWVVDLLERHANVVLMRQNTGRFVRSTMHPNAPVHRPPVDEDALMREVSNRFWDDSEPADRRTLFDTSTQRKTIRASLYAKSIF